MVPLIRPALLAALLMLAGGGAALAQSSEFPEPVDDDIHDPAPYAYLNDPATSHIAAFIARSDQTCGWLQESYRVDCLRIVLREMADEIPPGSEYDPVRRALGDAADRLDRLVSANLDTRQPPQRLSVGNRPLAPRLPSARAVRPAAEAAVRRQALAIVAEAETVLLRAAENSARRQVHFQQIAAAVGSTKVLLRSG